MGHIFLDPSHRILNRSKSPGPIRLNGVFPLKNPAGHIRMIARSQFRGACETEALQKLQPILGQNRGLSQIVAEKGPPDRRDLQPYDGKDTHRKNDQSDKNLRQGKTALATLSLCQPVLPFPVFPDFSG
jgi:hypothetical protein